MKKTFSIVIACILVLSAFSVSAVDYDEVGAYYECCHLYPDFVQKVKDEGVNDDQIIYFLGCVEKHLFTREDVLCEENFDEYMFDAIQYAFNLRKNIKVRNALSAAYPDSVPDAVNGIITEEFRPIYDTVKRYLFGIKTPVMTISRSGNETTAHWVNMPEDTTLFLTIYNSDGVLLHAKELNCNEESTPIECDCTNAHHAKLFAWENLAPVCDSVTLIFN